MEKLGLVRAIQYLHEYDFAIGTLVTDRHPQERKYMRENMPETKHYYDVWHVAKGELCIPVNTCVVLHNYFVYYLVSKCDVCILWLSRVLQEG